MTLFLVPLSKGKSTRSCRRYTQNVFTQYPVAQSDFELDKPIILQELFLSQSHRGHREEIFVYFLNLCVSVNSVRYNLFALPLHIQ